MNLSTIKDKWNRKKKVKGFQVLEEECIWMKAGVVAFRACDNRFDCNSCPFDKGMRKAIGIDSEMPTRTAANRWVENLRKTYHGDSRPCRHALTGRVEAPKICTLNYECYHCPYDQMLDEMDLTEDTGQPAYELASGYRLAEGYHYHMGHSWARFEHGGRVRIGFDDFLVKVFGAMTALTLPPLGEGVKQNQVAWTFARDRQKAAVLAPVTGTVLAVNHRVLEHPEITHADPYRQGWLFIVEPDMPKRNLRGLYYGKERFDWMEAEVQRLMRLIGPEYEQMSATGGEVVSDLYGSLPGIDWQRLVKEFLGTKRL